jgi:hypothetical protein
MAAKSGKPVTAVEPTEPEEAFEADEAKPGKVAKVKAKQVESKTGKYGKQKVPAHKPPDAETASDEKDEKEEEKNSWIEIELVGEDDKPIPGEKYEIELPDGKMAKGTLDNKGFARVEGFEAGNCKVSFPKLDKDAWSK